MKTIKVNSKQNTFNFNSGDMVFVFDKKIPVKLGLKLLASDDNYEFVSSQSDKSVMATAISIYNQDEDSARYIIRRLISIFDIKIIDEYKID